MEAGLPLRRHVCPRGHPWDGRLQSYPRLPL